MVAIKRIVFRAGGKEICLTPGLVVPEVDRMVLKLTGGETVLSGDQVVELGEILSEVYGDRGSFPPPPPMTYSWKWPWPWYEVGWSAKTSTLSIVARSERMIV